MLTIFERLRPTDTPDRSEPPPHLSGSSALCAPGRGPVCRPCSLSDSAVALLDFHCPRLHGPHRHPDHGEPAAKELFGNSGRTFSAWRRVLLIARPCALTVQNLIANQAISVNVSEPHPLAEPLVRGTRVLGILQFDFVGRIANRVTADGTGDRRDVGRPPHQRLVYPGFGTAAMILLASSDPGPGIAGRRYGSSAIWSCYASWSRACATARRKSPRPARH